MSTEQFTMFGLHQAQVKLQGSGIIWTEVPSVEEASFKVTVQVVKQYGNDVLQNTFFHTLDGNITLKHNIESLNLLSLLSGNQVGSFTDAQLGVGNSMLFGLQAELNQPYVSVRALAVTRRQAGGLGLARLTWFRCASHNAFDGMGMARAKVADKTLMLEVVTSPTDEYGVALLCSGYGRLEVFDTYVLAC